MNRGARIAVYTGSFDPYHLGHQNIVRRASRLFDRLVIGVGENPEKRSVFSQEERVTMIEELVEELPNVDVRGFSGLAVRFVREEGARVLLRGIRALSDIEYEFTMTLTNSTLDEEIETVFLMADKEYGHLSSTLIRQIAALGGDLRGFVPEPVIGRLEARFRQKVGQA
ncbi:Phosphopantetheine adenylyltransferase [Planctomycetes bacterium Pan216]|uniref:Phosphopantetheine adenylyltransferase n=1 Tax=Kolteria novifilia TaxID=2527975 RepID=A0A518B727_9BACT|nr:Phosphopantetheine adenylyltransferase [Planctomycetes bacterium Pan216]